MPEDSEPDYRIPPGGGVPWRALGTSESRRTGKRDIVITNVRTMALAGNFTWGIVKIETDGQEYGIGETFLAGETLDIVERMSSLLEGENPLDSNRLLEHLNQRRTAAGGMGQAAFTGIEIALWDLKGKLLGVPIYELFGGKFRDEIQIYCDTHGGESLGEAATADPTDVYTPESYAQAAREVVDAGFDMLKFDLDVPTHRHTDTAARRMDNEAIEHKVSLVEAVRDEIGYNVDLGMDLHWNFTVETATRLGQKLEPYDLAFLEDPVPPEKVEAHRRVNRAVDVPILTGENTHRAAGFNELVTNDAVDIAAPDVNHCGGLTEFRTIAAICDLYGVPMAPHNISSPIGTVAGVHAGASIPNFLALEYHAYDVPWWADLVTRTDDKDALIDEGHVVVPEGPGLGIEINPDVAEEYLTEDTDLIV